MSYFGQLREATLKEIGSQHVGTPVFVRLLAEVSADHGHLLESTTQGILLCEELLGVAAEAVYASGSVESGHVSAQLKLAVGRSALVTVGVRRPGFPRLDLLVVGNHGTIRHAPSGERLAGRIDDAPLALGSDANGRSTTSHAACLAAVEASLAQRQEVRVDNKGGAR